MCNGCSLWQTVQESKYTYLNIHNNDDDDNNNDKIHSRNWPVRITHIVEFRHNFPDNSMSKDLSTFFSNRESAYSFIVFGWRQYFICMVFYLKFDYNYRLVTIH